MAEQKNFNWKRLRNILLIVLGVVAIIIFSLAFIKGCKDTQERKMVVLENAPENIMFPSYVVKKGYSRDNAQEIDSGSIFLDEDGNVRYIDKDGTEYLVRPDGTAWKVNDDGTLEKVEGGEKDRVLTSLYNDALTNKDLYEEHPSLFNALQSSLNKSDIERNVDLTTLSPDEIDDIFDNIMKQVYGDDYKNTLSKEEIDATKKAFQNLIDMAKENGESLTLGEVLSTLGNGKTAEEMLHDLELDALKTYLDSLGIEGITPEELLEKIKESGMTLDEYMQKALKDGVQSALESVGVNVANLRSKDGSPLFTVSSASYDDAFNEIKKSNIPEGVEIDNRSSYEKAMDAIVNMGNSSVDYESMARALNGNGESSYSSFNGQSAKVDYLKSTQQGTKVLQSGKITDNMLTNGTIINGVLLTSINTDLPSSNIVAVVSENVYDSFTHSNILIPKGSRLIGGYDSNITFGQERILVSWTQLIREDGTIIQLNGYSGTSRMGESGLSGSVNNHIGGIIGGTALSSVIALGTGYSQNVLNGTGVLQDLVNTLSGSTSAITGDVLNRYLEMIINRQPTLTLDAGSKITILTNDNVEFPIYRRTK